MRYINIYVALVVENEPANAGDARDKGLIPGSGRSPGKGNPFQYSCLENPMDGGAWWATVCRVTQSQMKWLSMHTHASIYAQWNTAQSLAKKEKKKEWANIHSNFDEGKKSHMEQKKPDPPTELNACDMIWFLWSLRSSRARLWWWEVRHWLLLDEREDGLERGDFLGWWKHSVSCFRWWEIRSTFFFFLLFFDCVACGILVPHPGIELAPPAMEVRPLNH